MGGLLIAARWTSRAIREFAFTSRWPLATFCHGTSHETGILCSSLAGKDPFYDFGRDPPCEK
jgi:hypothetical protein